MPACPSCGIDNPPEARFCMSCAAPLVAAESAREHRKVVTILFCDLVGSTALGESTDPEVVRTRLARTFEELRTVLERHGGTVEKFVGDAVMAVFGIPLSHEDDALRAVRAASEMQEAVVTNGLEARIGVNTGEVVVGGEGETLVTGDAVNVAARLEQSAEPGSILIGGETRVLVRDAVHVEAVEPLAVKGKSGPVEAFRLLEIVEGAAPLARHLEIPLVGRERERQRLWRDYEDAVADSTCRLFTLLGPAGIGKSRLVADFLERVGSSADVLRGRCLSYGEGITYWPLVEMLIGIGVEPDSVIGTSPPETQLAFRRLLESRAAEKPQVVVVDDLQWAEPVFVDLVEHVADFTRDAPVFLLCVARTELLDTRPGWSGGKLNAASLLLEPLDHEECGELMDLLVENAALDDELRERITQASAGNPLYVEEMLAMVREQGDSEIPVPPTIHALLQARIDALDGDVRAVMERGAVEGEVFHRGAVSVLAPDPVRPAVEGHLATLVRKELIRSTAPTFPDDEGFRFRHLLIRDAAYDSLPKATRAELHERFADWLSTHELVEGDEIVGYHLEQAHRYRAELDPADSGLPDLAKRAARHLSAAGHGAVDRGDWAAARLLLQRARTLLPTADDLRAALSVDLTYVLAEGGALAEAREVVQEAVGATDPVVSARGMILASEVDTIRGLGSVDVLGRREQARLVLEDAADDVGLAWYWRNLGFDGWAACQAGTALERWERALVHAEAAGAIGVALNLQGGILGCLVLGPTPVPEALARVEEVLSRAGAGGVLEAEALMALGSLRAMEGRIDEGRSALLEGWRTIREAGHLVNAAGLSQRFAFVEVRAGDLAAEERVLRKGLVELERLDDRTYLPTIAVVLADCLLRQGQHDEATGLCTLARERTLAEDSVNFVYLDALDAHLAARAGRLEEAERLARRALERADTMDLVVVRGMRARGALAEILALRGAWGEANAVAAEAVSLHRGKGDVAGVAVLEQRFRELGLEVP